MILAIDAGTKTGWCLVEDGKIMGSGVEDFKKKKGESNGIMFLKFRGWLQKLLSEHQDIDLVAYEAAHHRGGYATEVCVNLTGRVQEVCAEREIEYVSVHTGTLKKFATGDGAADKAMMIMQAAEILEREPVSSDEADAVLLALCAYKRYGMR